MNYTYYICDVFTSKPFSGNQLAVFPDAQGLTDSQMQSIAREFNFTETTFVLPAKSLSATRHVRIFTPTVEVPFAGHPNIGTAFVLATNGDVQTPHALTEIVFEEKAGNVPVLINKKGHNILCEIKAPEQLSLGEPIPVKAMANILCLSEDEIETEVHQPREASIGLPFIFVQLKNRAALENAKINIQHFEALVAEGLSQYIHVYIKSDDDFDVRARVFAPLDGVPEDPATGSANGALAAMLAYYDSRDSITLNLRIAQGVEMGRPSTLVTRVVKEGHELSTFISGSSVMVSKGEFYCEAEN